MFKIDVQVLVTDSKLIEAFFEGVAVLRLKKITKISEEDLFQTRQLLRTRSLTTTFAIQLTAQG